MEDQRDQLRKKIQRAQKRLEQVRLMSEQMEIYKKTGEMAPELRRFIRESARVRMPRIR